MTSFQPVFSPDKSRRISVWHHRLNRSTWLSPTGNYLALSILSGRLRKDDPYAASSLAHSLYRPIIPEFADRIASVIRKWFSSAAAPVRKKQVQLCLNAIWEAWYLTRSPSLSRLLGEYRLPASSPALIKCASLLQLGEHEVLQNASNSTIQGLIPLLDDPNPEFVQSTIEILKKLKKQDAIGTLCRTWEANRNPILESIITQARYLAKTPHTLRLLTTLLHSPEKTAPLLKPEDAPWLLDKLVDQNPEIQQHTRQIILGLANPTLQNSLCLSYIHSQNDELEKLLRLTEYAPQEKNDQVLFYFLLEKWEKIQQLDFDQRILKSLYPSISPELRLRLTRKIQTSGKIEYLPVLTEWSNPYAQRRTSLAESELLVKMLSDNCDYAKLWQHLVGFFPPTCLLAIQQLVANQWQPDSPDERTLFKKMADFTSLPIQLDAQTLKKTIPYAFPRARLNVSGRINDISIHPQQPIIAIGTGVRKVVLWNYHNASTEMILDAFDHSIARLTYLPDETLVIGERSNKDIACGIYTWKDRAATRPGFHQGGVTAILAAGPHQFISCGRDDSIIRWQTAPAITSSRIKLPIWARTACISPDHHKLYFFDDEVYQVNLKQSQFYKHQNYRTDHKIIKSVARCAAFAPSGKYFLVGQYNGQLIQYELIDQSNGIRQKLIHNYPSPIQDIQFLPEDPIFMVSSGNGAIHFSNETDFSKVGEVSMPEGKLTSCYISPDGRFMASGANDSTMILWDLQTRKLANLFNQPVSLAEPDLLGTIQMVIASNDLPADILNGIKFISLLLQYRFLYDVEISDIHAIQPGEYDIEIT